MSLCLNSIINYCKTNIHLLLLLATLVVTVEFLVNFVHLCVCLHCLDNKF